jgi:hypothetical protein
VLTCLLWNCLCKVSQSWRIRMQSWRSIRVAIQSSGKTICVYTCVARMHWTWHFIWFESCQDSDSILFMFIIFMLCSCLASHIRTHRLLTLVSAAVICTNSLHMVVFCDISFFAVQFQAWSFLASYIRTHRLLTFGCAILYVELRSLSKHLSSL